MSFASGTTALLLFPGALGDFLCFLPAAQALQRRLRTRVTLVAKPAYANLIDQAEFETVAIDSARISALFERDLAADRGFQLERFDHVLSWTGSTSAELRHNLAERTAGRAKLFPFRGFRPGQHASRYFAECIGIDAPSTATIFIADAARRWAADLLDRPGQELLVMHPGSGSPAKNWKGMADLADLWRGRGREVLTLLGPAEESHEQPDRLVVRDRPLDRVAALLQRAPLYLGNDSGVSHLAAAVGCRGLAVFGETDPTTWQPGGSVDVLRAGPPCQHCGPHRICEHRLAPAEVLQQLEALGQR